MGSIKNEKNNILFGIKKDFRYIFINLFFAGFYLVYPNWYRIYIFIKLDRLLIPHPLLRDIK